MRGGERGQQRLRVWKGDRKRGERRQIEAP